MASVEGGTGGDGAARRLRSPLVALRHSLDLGGRGWVSLCGSVLGETGLD